MKRCIFVLSLLAAFLLFSLSVCANELTEEFVDETLGELYDRVEDSIPDEAEELLEELDLQELNWRQLLSLTPADFSKLLKESLTKQVKEPMKLFAQTTGVLILCSFLFPLRDSLLKGDAGKLFNGAAVVCVSLSVTAPVVESMERCIHALQNSAVFLLSLIPVLCGILTAGGQIATASGYQLLLFSVCQLLSQLAVSTVLPLLRVYFAVSILSSVFPQVGLQSICSGIKQTICWGLGIVTTMFVAFLSLQTFVTSNVDVVTLKASRFLMGSFIPVVGSILSEAFGAAQGCMTLLKGTVGSFGILVALCTMLPVLLQIILWYFVTWAAVQLSNMLHVQELSSVLKSANNTFAILLALLLCFLLLIVVATSLVIFIGTGG